MRYRVFYRSWWKENPNWPNGLEPCPGKRYYINNASTELEAQALCQEWCRLNPPGRLSIKAEYEIES